MLNVSPWGSGNAGLNAAPVQAGHPYTSPALGGVVDMQQEPDAAPGSVSYQMMYDKQGRSIAVPHVAWIKVSRRSDGALEPKTVWLPPEGPFYSNYSALLYLRPSIITL